MSLRFSLEQWAAWAPGLESQADWLAWFAQPGPLTGDQTAALSAMPAMMRRRMDPLGRAALQSAYAVQPAEACPMVFASRWGDLARSVGMLEQLAQAQPLSPTAFSLSVHNAIGALYSIARQDRSNYSAVSAGEYSAEAGVAEAQGLLADGAPAVLLVCFDAPLPEVYAQYSPAGEWQFIHAWAALLRRVDASHAGGLSLQADIAAAPAPAPSNLPADLRTLEFLLGPQAELQHGPWRWTRHAG